MTVHEPIKAPVHSHARARALEARWQKLCRQYLPRAPHDSMWRYHSASRNRRPAAGWKLHVSATILNAPTIFKKIAPLLIERDVWFKAPRSLDEVLKLNSGLIYDYSQIGKIVTVYPQDDREAVYLAGQLHELTRGLSGPVVPFDLSFGERGSVYYRFGAFERLEIEHRGRRALGLRTPDGKIIPDTREEPRPEWVADPFLAHIPPRRNSRRLASPALRVMKVLTQRGKGGVYEAIDFSGDTPQLCLLKEGRRNGEVAWDGRDGAWRVRHEKRVLSALNARGVPVPRVHESFTRGGNYYLVMDHLSGETLHDYLIRRSYRVDLSRVLDWGMQLAAFLTKMHEAGWAWRDCKPKNILITSSGRLAPIDFEGAAPIQRPDQSLWGTPGFTPPEVRQGEQTNGATDDYYALGAILYFLVTGKLFDYEQPAPIQSLRKRVYPELRILIESLLNTDARLRPRAGEARAQLKAIALRYPPRRVRVTDAQAA
jgi:Protein kinase domain